MLSEEFQFLHERIAKTERRFCGALCWELEQCLWLVFLVQVELGISATRCSDSSAYGHALHATPITSEEWRPVSREMAFSSAGSEATRNDAAGLPESWTA